MEGLILAIETSGDGGGAALLRGGNVLAESLVSAPRRHGAELMQCIENCLNTAKVSRDQLDVIAVNAGPGSYTGLRIGLSTASGIGHALDRPVVGVGSLDAMALQYVGAPGFNVALKRELWPVLDARQGEVMTARFETAGGQFRRVSGDMLVKPSALHEQSQHAGIVFGSGVAPYTEQFSRANLFIDSKPFALLPSSVGLQAHLQLYEVYDRADIPRAAVEARYFRRVTAKTLAERAKAS